MRILVNGKFHHEIYFFFKFSQLDKEVDEIKKSFLSYNTVHIEDTFF